MNLKEFSESCRFVEAAGGKLGSKPATAPPVMSRKKSVAVKKPPAPSDVTKTGTEIVKDEKDAVTRKATAEELAERKPTLLDVAADLIPGSVAGVAANAVDSAVGAVKDAAEAAVGGDLGDLATAVATTAATVALSTVVGPVAGGAIVDAAVEVATSLAEGQSVGEALKDGAGAAVESAVGPAGTVLLDAAKEAASSIKAGESLADALKDGAAAGASSAAEAVAESGVLGAAGAPLAEAVTAAAEAAAEGKSAADALKDGAAAGASSAAEAVAESGVLGAAGAPLAEAVTAAAEAAAEGKSAADALKDGAAAGASSAAEADSAATSNAVNAAAETIAPATVVNGAFGKGDGGDALPPPPGYLAADVSADVADKPDEPPSSDSGSDSDSDSDWSYNSNSDSDSSEGGDGKGGSSGGGGGGGKGYTVRENEKRLAKTPKYGTEETSFDVELRGRTWSTSIPKRASFHTLTELEKREKDMEEIKPETVANTLHGIRPAGVSWKKSQAALANPFVEPKMHELLQNPMMTHPEEVKEALGPDPEYVKKNTKVAGHTRTSKTDAKYIRKAKRAAQKAGVDVSPDDLKKMQTITIPKAPAKATIISKENAKTRISTVINDVALWHEASTLVDPTVVDDVTPMLLPGEEVIASLPMVAALGFPKFRDNRVGHGHVILTRTARHVITDKVKTDERHRRLIFMIAGKHQAYGGVEQATNNTASKEKFITCCPGGRCQFTWCCCKKVVKKDAFYESSAAAAAQIKASAAFSTIPVDDHVRGARAEAAEVTSIVRNWFTRYGMQKKKKLCCCYKLCRAECLFCYPCCRRCCPRGCFSCDVYEEGEESALEAKLKGIMSDTMNDAVFVEDKATSRKTELSRDQKTEIELQESETQKGGRLHSLIVSYQDPVTGQSSETVVLVDPKKATMMNLFQFASLTEPNNGQVSAGGHSDTGYAMLRKMADLDGVIDVQPKKKIDNFKILKKKDIPLSERKHDEIRPKKCCWCGPRWKYRQKKKAPIVKNVASKNSYGLLGFDPVVTNQPKKVTKGATTSLLDSITGGGSAAAQQVAADGTPLSAGAPPSSVAAGSSGVPTGIVAKSGVGPASSGSGNGKGDAVNDLLDFGWADEAVGPGAPAGWRNGGLGLNVLNNGLVFNFCILACPCYWGGKLFAAYGMPGGSCAGCCYGCNVVGSHGCWCINVCVRSYVTKAENINDGIMGWVCPLVCPQISWCQIMNEAKSAGKL